MARNDCEQLSERIGDNDFVERGMAHAGANRKGFPVARKLVESGNAIDIHEVGRLRETKRHDGNETLAARQNTAIFRCHLGQRLQRLIERLRHMVNEGRGFHAAEASGGELIICTQTINRALGLSNGRARELVTLRYSCPFIAAALSYPIWQNKRACGGGLRMSKAMRVVAAACLAGAIVAAAPTLADEAKRPNKVSFYFAAHEDDWQLFMNPSAFQDVMGGAAKTVFVHVTAGDAGLGIGLAGRKHPFYLARENGAEAAIRFMADADATPGERVAAPMMFNGHSVYRVSYRNTVGYFLRVPDGNASGAGYPETGFQSLKRLASGENDILRAVDGSATYYGWDDLVATLRAIIVYERGRAGLIQLNVAETDKRINPNDHADHLMTAKAALDAVSNFSCVRKVYYVDYASSRLPQNLDARQRDMESSVFAVTLAGIQALDHKTSWDHYDRSFVGRNYFRVQEPLGRCDAPVVAAVH